MKDDRITALSREYAKECIDPYGFSRGTYEEMVEEKAENVAYVLNWLSTRFCLVEKSKIQDEWQRANTHVKEAIKCKNSLSESCGKGKRIILKSLFPEIAKEVEE